MLCSFSLAASYGLDLAARHADFRIAIAHCAECAQRLIDVGVLGDIALRRRRVRHAEAGLPGDWSDQVRNDRDRLEDQGWNIEPRLGHLQERPDVVPDWKP